jgi:plastocyanin
LKIWSFDKIIVFSMLVFLIPITMNDVYAETFDVVIPQGAASPTNSFHFLPSEITVSVSDKIRWINFDDNTHTITSGSFQGGPDGIFNSGLLEKGEIYPYIADQSDIGTLSYYCTLHPWMNGIITVLDPEGIPVARVTESGSLDAALGHLKEAQSFVKSAKEFRDTGFDNQAAASYIQAGINYHSAALEYALLEDRENAAKYHHEAAIQHHNAALHFEKGQDFTQSVIQHHHAGIHHHFAGVSHEIMGDHKTARKHFAEAILHKGMAKFGSDYILPPRHQLQWLADPSELTCKEGLDIIFKSTTKEPVCVKPETVTKLIERGWGQQ